MGKKSFCRSLVRSDFLNDCVAVKIRVLQGERFAPFELISFPSLRRGSDKTRILKD